MFEQANYGTNDSIGIRLINHADDAVLPVGEHDFSEVINRCLLVDKTMFIAGMLDCEASVALCCRPKGFGKSMNLSMLTCYLERPIADAQTATYSSAHRFGRRVAAVIEMSMRATR